MPGLGRPGHPSGRPRRGWVVLLLFAASSGVFGRSIAWAAAHDPTAPTQATNPVAATSGTGSIPSVPGETTPSATSAVPAVPVAPMPPQPPTVPAPAPRVDVLTGAS